MSPNRWDDAAVKRNAPASPLMRIASPARSCTLKASPTGATSRLPALSVNDLGDSAGTAAPILSFLAGMVRYSPGLRLRHGASRRSPPAGAALLRPAAAGCGD